MRVLVSGAGIAGPTIAWWLARVGARVTVVEKASQLLNQGQNIDVHGTALNVINKMGLLKELRSHNTTEKGTAFVDETGRYVASFPLEGSVGSPTSPFEILRGDLADLLYRATQKDSNVEYRFSTTVSEVVENGEDKVKVKLSKEGEEKGEAVEEYDILVAADGQWSRIRKEVLGTEGLKVVDKGCYCIYWTVPRTKDDSDWWEIHQALNSRGLSTRPDNHGTTRAFLTCMPNTDAQKKAWEAARKSHDRQQQIELVKSEFADVGWKAPRLLAEMDSAPDLYFQSIAQIRLAKWSKGRVICLGDTAYAPTPFTGMGTSLAINGAYLLAGHLSQLSSPNQHPRTAFEAYEKEFKPFVEETQNIPWFVPGIAHPRYAWSRWMFYSLMNVLSNVVQIPWLVRKYGPKDKKYPEGLVDDLDGPYTKFEALEKAQSSTRVAN